MSFRNLLCLSLGAALVCLDVSFSHSMAQAPLLALEDVPVLVAPSEEAPEIFILDHLEIIFPARIQPKDKIDGFYPIEVFKLGKKKAVLFWLKEDPVRLRVVDPQQVTVEILPKWRTSEATIYSKPGFSPVDCSRLAKKEREKLCLLSATRGTPLTVFGSRVVEAVDPADMLVKLVLYYQVSLSQQINDKSVVSSGWVHSEDVLVRDRLAPTSPPIPIISNPPVNSKPPINFQLVDPTIMIPPTGNTFALSKPPEIGLDEFIRFVTPHMGICTVAPEQRMPVKGTAYQNPAFTQVILPYWKKNKLTGENAIPPLTYKGRDVTSQELLTIDTLARNIYGEMATCNYSTGSGYLMAVARIVLNRTEIAVAEPERRKQFMCNPEYDKESSACKNLDDELLGDIIQVLIKPAQFSTWNNRRTRDLRRVFCPSGRQREIKSQTTDTEEGYRYDINNWQDSLRVATETILDTEAFKEKTRDLANIYFYASGNARIPGTVRISKYPVVLGQVLDRAKCMKFLRQLTSAEKEAARKEAARREAARKAAPAKVVKPTVKTNSGPVPVQIKKK